MKKSVAISDKIIHIMLMVCADEAKKRIKERGLKISWVAGEIGVNPDTLGKFLNGKLRLGRSAQILLCRVLGLGEKAS